MIEIKTRAQYDEQRSKLDECKQEYRTMQTTLAKENRAMNDAEVKRLAELRAQEDEIKIACLQYENERAASRFGDYAKKTTVRKSDDVVLAEIVRSISEGNGIPEEYKHLRSGKGLLIPSSVTDFALRDASNVHSLADVDPVVPVTVKEIIEALEPKTILGQLGLNIQTGIQGEWNFPTVGGGSADWTGENTSVTASEVTLGKITPSPKRLPARVNISNTAIWQSAGSIRSIVLNRMKKWIPAKLNQTLLSPTQLSTATLAPTGPFVNAPSGNIIAASGALSTVTRANLLNLRSAIYAQNVDLDTPAFIINPATWAQLANTKIDAGSGRFVLDLATGTIDGVKAIMSTYVPAGYILFGEFSECMLGQFGDMTMTIDNSSADVAGQDLTVAVINSRWDIKAAHQEAFGYITYTTT